MRVLRLLIDHHHRIELHPGLTVVTGLTDDQRTTLRRAFLAAGVGLGPSTTGLIEAHGVLLDLDQDGLDLLDVAARPTIPVVASSSLPGTVSEDDADRLLAADRDVVALAAARRRFAAALVVAEATARDADDASPSRRDRVRRAQLLRRAIAMHHATDPEPLRAALDLVRDAKRLAPVGPGPVAPGAPGGTAVDVLADALAVVGIDVRGLDLPVDEVTRIAEDWLDERQRDAAWVVGAGIELQGLEATLGRDRADVPTDPSTVSDLELANLRADAERATAALAAGVARADDARRDALVERPARAKDLEWHVLSRLAEHRGDRVAGAVPLVLDHVFERVADGEVTALLDRFAHMAGSVQLVLVDDDPQVVAWARDLGMRRAAVMAPAPDDTGAIWP